MFGRDGNKPPFIERPAGTTGGSTGDSFREGGPTARTYGISAADPADRWGWFRCFNGIDWRGGHR
jgi:hypothetical protein